MTGSLWSLGFTRDNTVILLKRLIHWFYHLLLLHIVSQWDLSHTSRRGFWIGFLTYLMSPYCLYFLFYLFFFLLYFFYLQRSLSTIFSSIFSQLSYLPGLLILDILSFCLTLLNARIMTHLTFYSSSFQLQNKQASIACLMILSITCSVTQDHHQTVILGALPSCSNIIINPYQKIKNPNAKQSKY